MFSYTVLTVLDKITDMYKQKYKISYKIRAHKSSSLKNMLDILLNLVVIRCTEKFKGFNNGYEIIFTTFKNTAIFFHYYKSFRALRLYSWKIEALQQGCFLILFLRYKTTSFIAVIVTNKTISVTSC